MYDCFHVRTVLSFYSVQSSYHDCVLGLRYAKVWLLLHNFNLIFPELAVCQPIATAVKARIRMSAEYSTHAWALGNFKCAT